MKRFYEKQASLLCTSDLKTFKGKSIYWIMCIVLIIQAFISLVPSLWITLTAFKTSQEVYNNTALFPQNFSVDLIISRISEAWTELKFGPYIFNTVVLSIGNWVIGIVVCGLAGYVISRLKPRGSKVIFALILWTMMMPSQMRTVPQYMSWIKFPFVADFGFEVSLLDTYWPMWLSTAANAYFIMLFKNFFDTIPISYIEAARIDGCENLGVFFRIIIPLSVPIILYVSIGFLSSGWASFFLPYLVISDPAKRTVPLTLYYLKIKGGVKMNDYMMGLMLACIVPFVIFVFMQKYIIGGINVGGVKG